ncbi:hypothetical protein NQ314_019332 [Rhamnusium bicolor]|uniref:Uncharacterized protein n=1 Tax=Rhamnusium bicolor TaxID=1586634 RepID=A0AAV8WQV5_9CUCU|nr:hypothetical protein NQ314_019332 [Rhamnusium bicolor]
MVKWRKKRKKNIAKTSVQNGKEKTDKKYNFYRKPSIKKKAPEVKQTLTSYKRMLKANPLLKYEMEGVDFPQINKQLLSNHNINNASGKQSVQSERQSVQPTFNSGKPIVTNLQRSKSLKNPPKTFTRPQPPKKVASCIISGCIPKAGTSTNSLNISKQSNVDFNASTPGFLCSTRLENNASKRQNRQGTAIKSNTSTMNSKAQLVTQDNSV